MSLLNDWLGYQQEFVDAIKTYMQQTHQNPPQAVLDLLKTQDLQAALQRADTAEQQNDVDGIRAAQAKCQKFCFAYANQLTAAKAATKPDPAHSNQALSDLHDAFLMFIPCIGRTQNRLGTLATTIIKAARDAATTAEKKRELDIKSALSPLRLKSDWKAAKVDFERATGQKKPSAKILGAFRETSNLEKAMGEMDTACEKADPKGYRKGFNAFVAASSAYASILEKALVSDKAADPVYKTKCEGLKNLLNSIENRAQEKIRLLDGLNA